MLHPKIRCNGVAYRQGFLEVTSGIHPRHINLEVWNVHPDTDLANRAFDDAEIPDEAIVANTEIELNVQQAKALIAALQASIDATEKSLHHGV